MEAVPLTSADWVDPATFKPLSGVEKRYDAIMVGNWSRGKRHELLFRTLAGLQRRLRVALLGFPWERERSAIEREMARHGVSDQCEIFERVPAAEVNRLLNASRVNLLLSRSEGGNKSLYEAMFAGVASIVSSECQGLATGAINEQTGMLAADEDLGAAILSMLDSSQSFRPRDWAMQHTGHLNSTATLNAKLKELETAGGGRWTTDIVAKVNRPNLEYARPEDGQRMAPELASLAEFLGKSD